MNKEYLKKRKSNKILTREELEALDKTDLIDQILQLRAYNDQLKVLLKQAINTSGLDNKKKRVNKICRPFDFSRHHTRHILLKFYYLGWNYNGFVTQENTMNTVENHLFSALIKSCCIKNRESVDYQRCGRTDKGVSAFSQVVSLNVRSKLDPNNQNDVKNELPYCKMLNRLLPDSIKCIAWCPVPKDFSARFNCKFRTYKYFFPRGNLDVDAMNTAIKYVIGHHDFRNLCKMDVANGVTSFTRTIISANISVIQNESQDLSGYDMCELTIKSHAFLWHQIRCIMGILLLVGQRKESSSIMRELLTIESCPKKPQYNLANEIPLILFECEYENTDWLTDETELMTTVKTLQQEWTLHAVKSTMINSMLSKMRTLLNCQTMTFQSDNLLLGVQSSVYKSLMKREKCESLEDKIKYYMKKRKIESLSCNEEMIPHFVQDSNKMSL